MNAQHTQGPWTVHNGTPAGAVAVYCDSGNICILRHRRQSATANARTREQTIADAYLIAAAPDLLTVMQRLLEVVRMAECFDEYQAAEAAVAKATGMAANA